MKFQKTSDRLQYYYKKLCEDKPVQKIDINFQRCLQYESSRMMSVSCQENVFLFYSVLPPPKNFLNYFYDCRHCVKFAAKTEEYCVFFSHF